MTTLKKSLAKFNLSQACSLFASSIYSVTLSFIIQNYVSSPAINSLVNNISVD